MVRSVFALYAAAAATTAIAGILHLMLGPGSLGFNVNNGIFFIISGIVQIFWIIPMLARWGKLWYYVGIVGTIILIGMWAITRIPGNPITGRGGPVNAMAIATETFQLAFIGLAVAIIIYERMKRLDSSTATGLPMKKKSVMILAVIVVAIVLAGLFVPMSMGRPMGQPPGQPGQSPGQFGGPQQFPTQTTASTNQTCTLTPSLIEVEGTPQQTEGPYFIDEKLNRSDIRPDPSDGSVQEGVPLRLAIHVYDVDDGSCIPLYGAHVDIWHANYQGLYSDILEAGTAGKKYLRGYQVTDNNGTVQFTTAYPGWYEGRALHIHIKVRTFEESEKMFEWTSQFYLNDSITAQVHEQSPYSNHGQPDTTNNQDGIFTGPSSDGLVQNNSGERLMLDLTKDEQGYLGTFNVVVDASQQSE